MSFSNRLRRKAFAARDVVAARHAQSDIAPGKGIPKEGKVNTSQKGGESSDRVIKRPGSLCVDFSAGEPTAMQGKEGGYL